MAKKLCVALFCSIYHNTIPYRHVDAYSSAKRPVRQSARAIGTRE